MKRIILLIIINLFITVQIFSQWVYMDSLTTGILSFSSSGNYLYVCTTTNGIFSSVDSGFSWNESNNGISLTYMNVRSLATKDSILIAGAYLGLFKSTNYGMSWVPIINGISCLDINDVKFKGDSILVGSYGGGIFVSTDFGQNFTSLNNGLSSDLYIRCLFINGSRLFSGHAWDGGGIYASDDNGATWVPKNNGVPINPWNPAKYDDILCFTTNGQSLFASTWDCGILKSEDNGESWVQIQVGNNGVFNYINSITNYDGVVFAGCYGTGVYKSLDDGMNWLATNDSLRDYGVQAIYVYGTYLYTGTAQGHVYRRNLNELITGQQENDKFSITNIYPNPVTDIAKIPIPDFQKEQYSLSIYSMEGNLIKYFEHPIGNFFIIKKGDFENGLYTFLLMKNGSKISTGKFIIL